MQHKTYSFWVGNTGKFSKVLKFQPLDPFQLKMPYIARIMIYLADLQKMEEQGTVYNSSHAVFFIWVINAYIVELHV